MDAAIVKQRGTRYSFRFATGTEIWHYNGFQWAICKGSKFAQCWGSLALTPKHLWDN